MAKPVVILNGKDLEFAEYMALKIKLSFIDELFDDE